MANNKQDLIQALRNAHDAGDKESAKRIASIISQQEQDQESLKKLDEVVAKSRREQLLDKPISFVRGGLKSLTGLAGLPQLGQKGIDYLISQAPETTQPLVRQALRTSPISPLVSPQRGVTTLPTQEQAVAALEAIPGAKQITRYEPKSTGARFAESVGEFTFPTFGFGLKRALAVGGTTGSVQQIQEELGVEGAASIPLTLTTGLLSGYFTDPNRAVKLAREALKGSSDQEIALAKAVEEYAEKQGIKLTAPELIENDILSSLGSEVYGTKVGGTMMFEYIKNRPEKLQEIAENLFDEYIAKSPDSLKKIYKQANITAEEALDKAKTKRTLESRQAGYKVADNEFLDDEQVANIMKTIDDVIGDTAKGKTQTKLKEFKELFVKERIKPDDETLIIPTIAGEKAVVKPKKTKIVPETNVGKISEIYREKRDAIANSITGKATDEEALTQIQRSKFAPILDEIDKNLKSNKNYALGAEKYKELTESIVDPTIESIEPFLKGTRITPEKIKNLVFDPKDATPQDIRDTYQTLNKIDKKSFPNIARAYFDNVLDATLYKEGDMGRPSLEAGFDLYKKIAGTKKTKDNFNAILSGVAEAQGLNKNNVLLGFKKFNDVLKRTGRIVNIDNPQRPPDTRVYTRDAAQIGSFMWQVKFAGKYAEAVQNKTIKDLAKIFTQPDSVAQLEKLARTDITKGEALKIVTNILAVTNNLNYLPPAEELEDLITE